VYFATCSFHNCCTILFWLFLCDIFRWHEAIAQYTKFIELLESAVDSETRARAAFMCGQAFRFGLNNQTEALQMYTTSLAIQGKCYTLVAM
jgi:hypothetical protein